MAVFGGRDFSHRVALNEHSNFIENSRILAHLGAKRFVLFSNRAEKRGRIAQ